MAIVGGVVRLSGSIDRAQLERLLPDLVRAHGVVRLKGRVWLAGKALPLQIQMVGPRLNSWFEAAPATAWHPPQSVGLDLVVLSFAETAADAIQTALQSVVTATPARASSAASTPSG